MATHTSDGNKIKVADTGTTNGNYQQKILINQTLPMIITPIDPQISDEVAAGRGTTHARQTISSKVILTDTVHSGAHVFRNPTDISRMDTDGTIPQDGNTSIRSPRLTSPVLIGGGTTVYPTRTVGKDIIIPKGPTGYVEVRNDQPFHTSVNGNSDENGDTTPTLSKAIRKEESDDPSANIFLRCRMKFTRDAAVTKRPNFMNLGISAVHTSDELSSFSIPTTRIRRLIDGYNWIFPGHLIGEVTADIMSGTRSDQNCSSKAYFETMRENQDFERKNISMSRPPLDSTPFGTNTTNRKMSPIKSIPVGTKMTDPMPLT